MKKIYQICMFNAKTLCYFATYKTSFATKELAEKQVKLFNNPHIIFKVFETDLIIEKAYIQ